MVKTNVALSEAKTITSTLDSLILVAWNSAEGSNIDAEVYADIFAVMSKMVNSLSDKLDDMLQATMEVAE